MRHIRAVLACLALVASMLVAPAQAADSRDQTVFLVRSGLPGCEPVCPEWIYISGKISRQMVNEFEAILKVKAWEKPPVVLNSKGGGVDSAMAIGRLIRKHGLTSIIGRVDFKHCDPLAEACKPTEKGRLYLGDVVDKDASCEASCVFAYAGGLRRLRTYSVIAIPPFTDKAYETRKDKPDKKYLAEISAYFDEMGVALRAFDYLANAPLPPDYKPDQVAIISWKIATEITPASALITAVVCKSASPPVHCITRAAEMPSKVGGKPTKVAEKKKETPAKKKKAEPEKKESYMLPMKVVVVRSSEAGCEPTCPEWIQAEGEIKGNSAAEFRKVFKQIGKRKLPVIIRSPGGSVTAALEIGRMIRKRGLDVAVGYTVFKDCAPHDKSCKLPKEQKGVYRGTAMDIFYAFCTSACPLILASGTERIASDQTYVGLHQIRSTVVQQRITYREKYKIVKGKKKVVQRKEVSRKTVKSYEKHGLDKPLRKTLTAYLNEMGVGLGVLEDMEKAPPSDMYKLPAARVKELKLTTATGGAIHAIAKAACVELGDPVQCTRSTLRSQRISYGEPSAQPAKKRRPSVSEKDALLMVGITKYDKPMSVVRVRLSSSKCEPNCPEWFSATGVIKADTPRLFEEALKTSEAVSLPLLINSPGGDFDAAIKIGKFLRDRSVDVYVAYTFFVGCDPVDSECRERIHYKGEPNDRASCDSTCVLVLAGGRTRGATGAKWRVKLFGPDVFVTKSEGQDAASQAEDYLNSLGLSALWTRMGSLTGSNFNSLTDSELLELKLVNASTKLSELVGVNSCKDIPDNPICVKR